MSAPAVIDGRLDRLVYADLMRARYAPLGRDPRTGLDCLGLVLEIQRRLGWTVPDPIRDYDPAHPGDAFIQGLAGGAWLPVDAPEPGDAVLAQILDPDYPDHVGAFLGAGEVLGITATAGPVREDLAAWKSRGWFRGVFRPALGALQGIPADSAGLRLRAPQVKVLFVPDPIGGDGTVTILTDWQDGLTVWDAVPHERLHESAYARLLLRLNGWRITEEEARARVLEPGDELLVYLHPGIPVPAGLIAATGISGGVLAFVGNLAIGTLVGLLASIIAAPSKPRIDADQESASPTFNLGGVRNTVANGTTVAVIYGEHRFGGQVVQLFFEVDDQFRSTIFMLLSLGEGEIESIGGRTADANQLSGSAILGSAIEIDGNPIGSYPTAKISVRMGKTRQSPIPGFDGSVAAFGQAITLRATSPLVPGQAAIPNNDQTFLYTTSQAVDGFALLINYPIGLYKVDLGTGQEQDYSVFYTLRYQRKGNAASEVVQVVVHGPSNKKADHSRAIKRLGLTRDVYEIRITRMSDNDENLQRRFSVSKLTAVNEYVSDNPVAHNGKALLAIEAVNTGQLSGSVPLVTSVVKGKKLHIWDGVSTTAPAFTFAWSDNPAWVILDILLNKTYGLGAYVTLNEIDLPAFKALADYCDELITTDGTQHKRWQFNYVFDQGIRAWDAVGLVAASCRCSVVIVGSKYTIKIERATSSTQLFTMGNIVRGSFVTRYPKTLDRANMVRMQYRNAALDYDSDVAQLETGLLAGQQYKWEDVALPGVTNARQAYRAAKHYLNVSTLITDGCVFRAPIDSIACEPGQVIDVEQDVLLPGAAGGRVAGPFHPSGVLANIDRAIVVPASPAWALVIETFDTVTQARVRQTVTPTPGTYAAGTNITTSPAFTVIPADKDVYAIGPSTTITRQFRVISIRRNKNQQAELTCLRYVADVYTDDPGPIETFTELWPDTRYFPTNPTGLRILENTAVLADGTVAEALDVSFQPAKDGETHDIWTRRVYDDPSGETDERPILDGDIDGRVEWTYAGSSTTGQFKIREGIEPKRPYQVSVTPRSVGGNRRDPRSGALAVISPLGRVDFPTAPTNLKSDQLPSGHVRLRWDPSPDRDVSHYEIREALADGRKFLLSQVLASCVCGTEETVRPHKIGSAHVFQVTAVSRTGVHSILPAYLSVTPALRELSLLASFSEGATWPGTRSNMSLNGSFLWTDIVSPSTHSYLTAGFALGAAQGQVSIFLEATAWEVDWTVDEFGALVNSPHSQRKRVDGLLMEVPEPDQVLPLEDNHWLVSSPGCYLFQPEGMIDWPTRFKVEIQYQLSTDGGAGYGSLIDYVGPFQVDAAATHMKVKAVITNIDGAKLRIQIEELTVQHHQLPAGGGSGLDHAEVMSRVAIGA